ncbi:MAG TPA: hypothetical protein VGO61_22805 [Steroidobacteraceae bacterium]|jgi:hypothetical protein|nr:hypothetical protein [Steroidobacteraceae bacterium]
MRGAFAFLALAFGLLPRLALAADGAKTADEKLRGLGLAGSNVATPGFGRVLVVFLLVAALAWGASWMMRRYGLRFRAGVGGGATPIRHLARNTLPGGLTCHLVETQGRQVLITVARSGVNSLLLGDAPPAAPPAASPTPTGPAT